MPSFLHTADIHLDSPLRGLERYEGAPLEAVRGATRRAFENLVACAIEERVGFLLIAGDLYDGDWRDYGTGLFFAHQCARLNEAGIRVLVVAGNHDAESRITRVLRLPPNVHLFSARRAETIRLDGLGVAIHGRSFPNRVVNEDLAAGYPDPLPGLLNIGLLHTSLNGREGHAPYAPTTPERLRAKGYDYWALGHVHQREIVGEAPWIVFPGNLQGRHIREPGAKGATLVRYEAGEIRSVEARELDLLRWELCEVDAAGAAGPEQLLDRVAGRLGERLAAADGRTLCVRLRLTGATAAHARLGAERERWINELRGLANEIGGDRLWLERIEDATRPELDAARVLERDDALGGLLRGIRDLEADPERLTLLAEELAELRSKLPLALREAGLDPTDPAALPGALEGVKGLLLARLLEGAR